MEGTLGLQHVEIPWDCLCFEDQRYGFDDCAFNMQKIVENGDFISKSRLDSVVSDSW